MEFEDSNKLAGKISNNKKHSTGNKISDISRLCLKSLLLLSMIIIALAACSKDSAIKSPGTTEQGKNNEKYLEVKAKQMAIFAYNDILRGLSCAQYLVNPKSDNAEDIAKKIEPNKSASESELKSVAYLGNKYAVLFNNTMELHDLYLTLYAMSNTSPVPSYKSPEVEKAITEFLDKIDYFVTHLPDEFILDDRFTEINKSIIKAKFALNQYIVTTIVNR